MKLGNVSQSIVPVPKYFINNKSIDLVSLYSKTDTNFSPKRNIRRKRKTRNISYYRTMDILTINSDFNYNLNPRYNQIKSFSINSKKYIPLYKDKKYKNNSEIKGTYFPDIIYMNDIKDAKKNDNERSKTVIQQYKEYKRSTNIEQKINPDLRSDIVHNTENLIKQINMKFDFKRWNEFDSRTTMNLFHQPAYSPLADFNKNNITEKEAFSDTLRQKAIGLKTISNKAKAVIQKNLYENDLEENRNKLKQKNNIKKLKILIENSKNNFLNLNYNNTERPSYNKKDKEFILENKTITKRLNKTKLYHDFPSSLKEEFIEKRIYMNKRLFTSKNKNK